VTEHAGWRGQTPSQTVGPFFAHGLTGARYGLSQVAGAAMFPPEAAGEPIRLHGRVLDGAGAPIPDALLEAWQADASGRHGRGLLGFGRVETDADGRYAFTTVRPGSIGTPHAPHIGLVVMMRGLLTHLFTRLYLPEDSALHAADPVLSRVPAERRGTLVAVREAGGYRLDIRMQGEGETVFLEF
jgi:protocatechuate 3,4-dioxygenase alpha subunit